MGAVRRYGWRRSLPDQRDFLFCKVVPPTPPTHSPPPVVDLSPLLSTPYNQLSIGSCTSQAIAGHLAAIERKEKLSPIINPSRLFIYYNERAMEGSTNSDSGAAIKDGIKSVATQGVPDESLWPYNISQFTVKPPSSVYAAATHCKALQYFKILTQSDMLSCLASGFPFVFGFTVYQSFESATVAKTGLVPMPGRREQVLGGHAVLCYGYDQNKQLFKVRNSWGASWGLAGNFLMPFQYLTNSNLADDFWTIRKV